MEREDEIVQEGAWEKLGLGLAEYCGAERPVYSSKQ